MKKKAIRIKDIALKAGVSTGTVDRVLHNRGKVSEDVKERITAIIKELNYEPNLMARALGSNKEYRIAALIPDPQKDNYWEAPKAGIEKAEHDLKQYGILVEQFIFNPFDVHSYINEATKLTNTAPDGILLSPIFYRETLPFFEKWTHNEIPFVLFNTQITEYHPLSYIGQDSYQSGLVAGKLIHYGEPTCCTILIAHIDEEISNAAHLLKKEQGLRDYFKTFTQELDHIIEKTKDLKQIFVTTSKAHHIADYLEKRNIHHIRIIGYDLLTENLHYLNKGAISFLINQNPKGQGYWGIHVLTDHLVFKQEVPPIKYLPLDIVTKENLSYFIDKKII
jgi:LacI family transcriptional regulator